MFASQPGWSDCPRACSRLMVFACLAASILEILQADLSVLPTRLGLKLSREVRGTSGMLIHWRVRGYAEGYKVRLPMEWNSCPHVSVTIVEPSGLFSMISSKAAWHIAHHGSSCCGGIRWTSLTKACLSAYTTPMSMESSSPVTA